MYRDSRRPHEALGHALGRSRIAAPGAEESAETARDLGLRKGECRGVRPATISVACGVRLARCDREGRVPQPQLVAVLGGGRSQRRAQNDERQPREPPPGGPLNPPGASDLSSEFTFSAGCWRRGVQVLYPATWLRFCILPIRRRLQAGRGGKPNIRATNWRSLT